MNKTKLVKNVVRTVVTLGTGTVVSAVVRNNVPKEDRNSLQALTVPAGGFVLGSIVADSAAAHTDKMIDSFVDGWRKSESKTPQK